MLDTRKRSLFTKPIEFRAGRKLQGVGIPPDIFRLLLTQNLAGVNIVRCNIPGFLRHMRDMRRKRVQFALAVCQGDMIECRV